MKKLKKLSNHPLTKRLIRLPFVAYFLRKVYPHNSFCLKCGLPWSCCKLKSVNYSKKCGTFATCNVCWENSDLSSLKTYYTQVYIDQLISLIGTKYTMEHTLNHLLDCVEKEKNK